ncbi:MAG: hypothetical protein WCJ39_02695 [bacterium]
MVDYLLSLETDQERAEYYRTAYTMQVGFDDLRFWEQIKKDLEIKEEELYSPYFIGKVLFKKIQQGKGVLKNAGEASYDFRSSDKINALTFDKKRLLVDILKNMGYDMKNGTYTK